MNVATIFQAPTAEMINFYRGNALGHARLLTRLNQYQMIGKIETDLTGEAAAEEMFDLSNNPGRNDERAEKWGNYRSLSVGDIVFDGNESWVCLPMGWERV